MLDKSGKKFAPKKAPTRRAAGPESESASNQPSLDGHTQPQTPQPRTSPRTEVLLPASHVAAETEIPCREAPTATNLEEPSGVVRIAAPSRTNANQLRNSPVTAPRERQSENHAPPPPSITATPVAQTTLDSTPTANESNAAPLANGPSLPKAAPRKTNFSSQPQRGSTSPARAHEALAQEATERPAKRQKRVAATELDAPLAQKTTESTAPVPTTELDHTNATSESVPEVKLRAAQSDAGKNARKSKPQRKKLPRSQEIPNGASEPAAEAEPAGEPGEESQSQARRKRPSKTKARPRKRNVEEEAAAIVDDAVQGTTKNHRKRGRRSKRAETPEGAENERISTADTTMVELCRDTRKGRTSSRERRLKEMDRAAFVAKKQRELQELMDQEAAPNTEGPAELAQPEEFHEARQEELERTVVHQVPRTIIVDGQIRIDPDSLRIDRHAAAAAERERDGEIEVIDENDLSRKVTSGSWLKRDQSGRWNELLLDRLYQGLRMFGTDFEMISRMFPGKSRHAIKMKFCKEERLDYPRIKAALLGEKEAVVLEEYEQLTGAEYEHPRELERMMEEDRKMLEEEQAVEMQAMKDAEREREAQAEAEREAAQEDSGNQSEGNRGKRMKRGKDKQQRGTKSKSPGKGSLQGVGRRTSRGSIAAAA